MVAAKVRCIVDGKEHSASRRTSLLAWPFIDTGKDALRTESLAADLDIAYAQPITVSAARSLASTCYLPAVPITKSAVLRMITELSGRAFSSRVARQ